MKIKDLTIFLQNWWTYKQAVEEEVWFSTRIFWWFFKKNRLEISDLRDLWDIKLIPKWEDTIPVILDYKDVWYISKLSGFNKAFFSRDALELQEELCVWQKLKLEKQPNNPFDSNAVWVINSNWEFLWFLKREIAQYISDTENFIVQVVEPIDKEATWKKNEIGTLIAIINKTNHEKSKNS